MANLVGNELRGRVKVRDLARATGVTERAVGYWLSGTHTPPESLFVALTILGGRELAAACRRKLDARPDAALAKAQKLLVQATELMNLGQVARNG